MRVLVTFAVDAEFAPWRKLRDLRGIRAGDITLHQAQIGRAQVDFVVTGMGVENAKRVAGLVLEQGYQFCISSGFAGALRAQYSIGDVLVSRFVRQIGLPKTLEGSRNLFHVAARDGAKRANMFLTSESVIRTAEEKTKLAPFAEAVDMESFGVFSAAHARGCPVVAIRVISDRSDRDLPVAIDTMVDERGRVRIGGVIRKIAYYPSQLPALIRLGRDSRTAAEALARFLEAFLKQLSFLSHGWFPEGEGLAEVAAQ